MSIDKKSLFLFSALVLSLPVFSQVTRTPFSTFGIGESFGNALINNQGMGGVAVAQPQFWYANNANPALLVYNNLTVFQAGIIGEKRTTSADTISQSAVGGNLNYLVTAFPVKPGRWSTAISLTPYTQVNFRLEYLDYVAETGDTVMVTEEGSGGVSQLSWSNGVRITRNLALGLRASYLFGSIINSYKNQLTSTNLANYVAEIQERTYVKDFVFSAGASYSVDSLFNRKRYRLSFGAVYDFAADLSTRKRDLIYRTNSLGDVLDPDTLESTKQNISIPAGFTAGISLSRGTRWAIGTEFSYRDWSTFRSVSADDEGLKESWKFALGGEWTPDGISENYLKRVTYRLGGSIEEYPFLANNKKVQDLGINFGLSLPAGRSSLDLGFRLGQRGDKNENIFEEKYFRVFFGITFNDQWFIKRKFD